MIVMLATDLNQ